MAVRVTGAFVGQGGAFGPVEYAGNLYLIALSAYAETLTDTSEIAIFVSEDDGATWVQTGSTIEIPSATDAGGDLGAFPIGEMQFLHGCIDVDFPTEPYAYIIHCGLSGGYGCLFVSRFNASTGDFDATSAAGPQIPIVDSAGSHNFLGWMIAQADDREFGVLANLNTPDISELDRVYGMSLSADLGTWSGRDLVDGQVAGRVYAGAGIVRGNDGRVHGWVEELASSSTQTTMMHTMVIGGGGGVGSELESVYTFTDEDPPITNGKIFQSPYTGGYYDGEVVFFAAKPGSGVGETYNLIAARATSADPPSFTIDIVDGTAAGENSYWAGVGSSASGIDVAYNISNAYDSIHYSIYTGSSWTTPTEGVTDVEPYFITAGRFSAGLGISFGRFLSGENQLWFHVVGGGAIQITGVEPIHTKEQFYNTSGVTGGGLDTCGTPIAVEPSNACNPVDPDTAIDAPATCVPQGYSF